DSGGEISTSGTIEMIYTIGELVVQENTNANIYISEGFLSPDILNYSSDTDYLPFNEIAIYPNPAVDYLNFNFFRNSNYLITLTDFGGKKINSFTTHDSQFQINMSSYSNGVYIVVVEDLPSHLYKAYKIVKK
ncbi:MAG: T9SS type A sorting domain-containing protein, partial [Lutibacter sp.]|uniref:T9SS type A sorting domain-containing protein n=1 Tax=Lutibacter sp. TaxID=1925666 RepID=UPI00385C96C2